ncbi:MAG: DUF4956 domain-containing protein [Gemmatimonadaceae bacterium]|nr:DUF4956 domain-containing protein [Gemmatimonadaceae bacterium]
MSANGHPPAVRLGGNIIIRITAYYALLILALYVLHRQAPGIMPTPGRTLVTPTFPPANLGGVPRTGSSVLEAAVAMIGAVLLALPVTWVYLATRAKRGYQQSVVQTLVILPMVVAGVVALVKDSLPLAFGLAAIVAAVRFRTALDDSKDAVYVFLATGIGLAAAVDLPVAVVVSLLFNATVLLLWQTDFGRIPPAFEGRIAERRMEHIMEEMSRTGTFVARMDDEVFQDMSSQQLEAVADRAWRRARRNNPEAPDAEGRREALLRVQAAGGAEARRMVESVLDEHVKRWRFGSTVHEQDGTDTLEYVVTLRRGSAPDVVVAALCGLADGVVSGAELR